MTIKHYYHRIDNVTPREWLFGGYYIKPDGKLNPPSGSFGGIYSRTRLNLIIKRNKLDWAIKQWKKH